MAVYFLRIFASSLGWKFLQRQKAVYRDRHTVVNHSDSQVPSADTR